MKTTSGPPYSACNLHLWFSPHTLTHTASLRWQLSTCWLTFGWWTCWFRPFSHTWWASVAEHQPWQLTVHDLGAATLSYMWGGCKMKHPYALMLLVFHFCEHQPIQSCLLDVAATWSLSPAGHLCRAQTDFYFSNSTFYIHSLIHASIHLIIH